MQERPNVEEYAIKTPDYSMHFSGGGPFSSRKEVVDWAKQVAAQFNMFLITARAKKDIVSIVCERYGTSRCKGKKHTDTSNVDVVEESPVDAVDYNLTRKSRSKKCHCPFSLRGVEKRGRWVLKVTKGFHNHDLEDNGYAYRVGGKLTETQMQTVAILMRNHLKPKEIFEHIKMADPNTQSTMTNIYNACYKLRSQGLVEGNNMVEENKAVQADEENQNVGTSEMEKGVAYISQDAPGDEDSELLHKCFQEISSMPPDERRRWTKRLQEMLHSEKSPVQDPKARLNSKKRDYLALENTESTRSSAPKFSGSSDSSPSHGKKTKKSLLPSLPEAKPQNQPGNNAPLFFLPYITDWLDMARDGNCGYRAVAHTIYGDEKFWVRVRMELFRELGDRGDLYAKLFGGMDRVRETLHSIMHWEGPAPNNKWLTIFDMGWVIATKYNVLCVSISRHQCVSYLPLIAPDGVEFISRTIVVGYIQEEHHFMLVCFLSFYFEIMVYLVSKV